MYIQSIRLKNFRQFLDTEIEFNYTENEPISLIFGDNASGKTTLVNAIKWCFWGKEDFRDKNLLNCQIKNEMQLGEKRSAEVEIVFNFNEKIYTLKRKNIYELVELEKFINSQELGLSYIDKSGEEHIIENQNIKQKLEEILPSNISELMFLTESNYHFSKTSVNDILKFIKDNHDSTIEPFPLILDSVLSMFDPCYLNKISMLFKESQEQMILLSTEHGIDADNKNQLIDSANTCYKIEADCEGNNVLRIK